MNINWEMVLQTVGGGAAVIAAVTYLVKAGLTQVLARDLKAFEIGLQRDANHALKTHEADLKLVTDRHFQDLAGRNAAALEVLKAGIVAGAARDERVRKEIERWANPILGAVLDLKGRIHNIQRMNGYVGLDRNQTPPGGWRIGYDYFLPSTVFVFAQYFCCIRLLQESLTFELASEAERNDFLKAVRAVGHPLSTWPLTEKAPAAVQDEDAQIFSLQQRAIGDSMIAADTSGERCMRAGSFFERWADADFRARFQPLVAFLDGLTPGHVLRWERLARMDAALETLKGLCQRILTPAGATRA